YVKDVVSAYRALADRMPAPTPGEPAPAFNFSDDAPRTVLEVVEAVARHVGVSMEPDIRDEAPHEIHAQHLSSARARTTLGWSPTYSFDTGLVETVTWYRTYLADAR